MGVLVTGHEGHLGSVVVPSGYELSPRLRGDRRVDRDLRWVTR